DLIPERIPIPIPLPDPGPIGPRPGPGPDPAPIFARRAQLIRQIEDQFGRDVASDLERASDQAAFGQPSAALQTVLDAEAFGRQVPPPLPKELRHAVEPVTGPRKAPADEGLKSARASLAAR